MGILNIRDQQFYFETTGDPSAPPLLIITGITDYTLKAGWQIDGLASDYYIITFDNRGAGQSTTPSPGYTIDDMADDTAAILDALQIDSTHVFGFSMGGMIALNLAIRYPERVRRLVLGCTTAGGRLAVHPEQRVIQWLANPERSGDPRHDYFAGVWISISDGFAAENPDVLERLADIAAANPQTPIGYAGQFQAVISHDVAGRLGEIRAPTLVLHGEKDLLIPTENGRLLAQNIPGANLIVYPNAGHLFFIERAADVNRDIRHFLAANG